MQVYICSIVYILLYQCFNRSSKKLRIHIRRSHENMAAKRKKAPKKDPTLKALVVMNKMLSRYSETETESDAKKKSMTKLVGRNWICAECGRNFKNRIGSLRNHLETHLGGVSHQCPDCGKIYGSTGSMKSHYKNPKRCKNISQSVGPEGGSTMSQVVDGEQSKEEERNSHESQEDSLGITEDLQPREQSKGCHGKAEGQIKFSVLRGCEYNLDKQK